MIKEAGSVFYLGASWFPDLNEPTPATGTPGKRDRQAYLVCKRKLDSKKEALLILSKELDACQQERDQFKLMANQLRERHQSLKKKYRELIIYVKELGTISE
ncbi:hypothetical protein GW7_06103 [Heterocephalus glaber]|uniref:Uncharacterized protein n=1 Tax=Heterocephalus glaber TaxID=10181 RepID=G5B026_HETGA|nr:hypothetical protein GW7_06103 [Heterocephalus glaber]